MKSVPIHYRCRAHRAFFITGVIIIVALIIVIGVSAWNVWKWFKKNIAHRDGLAPDIEQTASELLQDFMTNHPGEVVSQVSTQVVAIPMVTPFETSPSALRILRSTNLLEWEVVGTNVPGSTWTDTAPPWPAGFYRQESIEGQ